jgi:hypothetical protein
VSERRRTKNSMSDCKKDVRKKRISWQSALIMSASYCDIVLNCIVQCSTVQYNVEQSDTVSVHSRVVEYNAIQYNMIQCSTVQYTIV